MAKNYCTYCQNSINTCRIKCRECTDFDLCLQCFACGAECGTHKKDHDYEVYANESFAVFDNEDAWTAKEEEALLDSIEQYGFGNWDGVGSYVKTRNSRECQEHYYTFFIHGNIGKATFPKESANKVTDHTCPDGGPLSPSLSTPLYPVELSSLDQHNLGYMPLRDDFEKEYDNDAENLVSSLALNYDDDDIDTAFKLCQADIYRFHLKERQHRKHFAREHLLIQNAETLLNKTSKTPNQTKKSKLSTVRDERKIQDRLRVFCQFLTHQEHEQFYENMKRCKQLRPRIRELTKFRKNGITKLDECDEYDLARVRRERIREERRKLHGYGTKRTLMATKSPFTESKPDSLEKVLPVAVTPEQTPSPVKPEKKSKNDVDAELDFIGNGDNGFYDEVREIITLPGSRILSPRERKLCSSIGMKPASYITIKTCIIKDYLQRRRGIQVKIRYPNHFDKTHRRKILNFLSENGWIGGIGTA